MEDLRQKTRDFLNKFDIRIAWAARSIGIDAGTLSKFLNGKTRLNARNEYKVRKFLGEINESSPAQPGK